MVQLSSGNYLKSSDVSSGDTITFKDEGKWVDNTRYTYDDGNPRVDFIITVDHKGEEKSMRVNKTNRDLVISLYGNDTANWVGKSVKVTKEKMLVAGKKCDVVLFDIADIGADMPNNTDAEDVVPF